MTISLIQNKNYFNTRGGNYSLVSVRLSVVLFLRVDVQWQMGKLFDVTVGDGLLQMRGLSLFFFDTLYVGRFGVVVVSVRFWFLVTDWLRRNIVRLSGMSTAMLLDFFQSAIVFFDRDWDFFFDSGGVNFVFAKSFAIVGVFN
uniref:hypothetical protein n=1 Tax=Providencia sp. PROV051 TaxID=2949779 RepID=UPI00234BF662